MTVLTTPARRTLTASAVLALALVVPGTSAWADQSPPAEPTPTPTAVATAQPADAPTASPDPTGSPTASPTDSPADDPTDAPTDEPTGEPTDASGCVQDPTICQSGGTTTDCGQLASDPGEPASPPPPGVVCIAGGLRPGVLAGGGEAGSGAGSPHLPMTGSVPLLPLSAAALGLLVLGVLVQRAGRRRTG